MGLDATGETFTPTGKQLSDKGETVVLDHGVAFEHGAGLTIIPEPPAIPDGEIYARGVNGGNYSWVRLDPNAIPPPPPFDGRYYVFKDGAYVDAYELSVLVDIKASDIKLDPPVLGKDNLQDALEELAKPQRRRNRE